LDQSSIPPPETLTVDVECPGRIFVAVACRLAFTPCQTVIRHGNGGLFPQALVATAVDISKSLNPLASQL
jgi:hypothetical protein